MKESRRTFLSVLGISRCRFLGCSPGRRRARPECRLAALGLHAGPDSPPHWSAGRSRHGVDSESGLGGRTSRRRRHGGGDPGAGRPAVPHEGPVHLEERVVRGPRGDGPVRAYSRPPGWSMTEQPTKPVPRPAAATAGGPRGVLSIQTRPAGVEVEARDGRAGHRRRPVRGRPVGPDARRSRGGGGGETLLRLTGPDFVDLTLLVTVPQGDSASIEAELVPSSPLSADMVLVPAGPSPAGAGGFPIQRFPDRSPRGDEPGVRRVHGRRRIRHGQPVAGLDDRRRSAAGVGGCGRAADRPNGRGGPEGLVADRCPDRTGRPPGERRVLVRGERVLSVEGKEAPDRSGSGGALPLAPRDEPYPWGADREALSARANFESVTPVEVESRPRSRPVGAFEMAGNVREWLTPEADNAWTTPSVGGSWQDPALYPCERVAREPSPRSRGTRPQDSDASDTSTDRGSGCRCSPPPASCLRLLWPRSGPRMPGSSNRSTTPRSRAGARSSLDAGLRFRSRR